MTRARIKIVAGAALAACLIVVAALPALAVDGGQEIVSAGPLTRVIVSADLTCQVAHRDDEELELFGGELGSCGTFLAVGGAVYGPLTGGGTQTPWTTVSQAAPTGAGSQSDPFRIVTVVSAPAAGLRLEQTDSYIVGSQSYRTDIQVNNFGGEPRTGILYRGGDCYLQNDDTGYGRVDGGAPACIVNPAEGRRIEQWLPITPGSHFFEGFYGDVYSIIASQLQFPDTCACNEDVDNGAGLSWSLNVGAGQSVVISHETFFSPVGRGAVQQSFTDSVPDPLHISLDPVVVASSVAVAAGVIVLVPFPSALFNSALEENYDEVMAGVGRLRAWLARTWARSLAWMRHRVRQRRAARAVGRTPTTGQITGIAAEPVPAPPAEPMAAPPAEPIAAPPAEPYAAQRAQPPPPGASPQVARSDPWRTPLGIAGFVVLTALLYGFLDPTFGFSLTSLATFVGLAIGLFVVLLAYGLPLIAFSQARHVSLNVRALPATLLVGFGCVLISRLANFQPGYLYGLIISFVFATSIPVQEDGRAKAFAAGTSLLVAFLAWVALAFVRSTAGGPADLTTAMFSAATVTIVVAGLENAVFAMLPLRFLPGAAVFAWDRRVWAVLIGFGIFGFAHVLLNPSAGYLADTTRTSFFTLIALLVGFGILSVLFWAYFRFRPSRPAHE